METKLKINLWMVVAVLVASILGCRKEMPLQEDVSTNSIFQSRVSEELSDFRLIDFSQDAVFESLANVPAGQRKSIVLPSPDGNGETRFDLERNNVVDDDFSAWFQSGNGLESSGKLGIRTFHGAGPAGERIALTISADYVAMEVEQNGEFWTVESAAKFGLEKKGLLIGYKDVWQKVRPESHGRPEDQFSSKAVEESISRTSNPVEISQQQCWQVDVMVIGDFAYYLRVGGSKNLAIFYMVSAVNNSSLRFSPVNVHLRIPSGNIIQNTQVDNLSSNYVTILNQAVWYGNTLYAGFNRDITMLYTGLDLRYSNGAWPNKNYHQGMLCSQPNMSYGVVETINGAYNTRIQTSAYAAIMGAFENYDCSSKHLMYLDAFNSNCAGNWLNYTSRYQIQSHLWYHHNCLYMSSDCN